MRSRKSSLADKRVQKQKRIQHEDELGRVTVEGQQLDNVCSFEYLGIRVQCDGDEKADVEYRMVVFFFFFLVGCLIIEHCTNGVPALKLWLLEFLRTLKFIFTKIVV